MPAGAYPFGFPTTHDSVLSENAKLWLPADANTGCDALPATADPLAFTTSPVYAMSNTPPAPVSF